MPLINPTQLSAMAAGAVDQFSAILEDFHQTSRQSLAKLEALEEGRFEPAREIAHQLKGASGSLGLQDFHLLAAECEQNLKQKVSINREQFTRLQQLLESSVNVAREHLKTLS
jgi:HPt (histidine-containing phosphotransfer) domain-containing protein